MLRVFWNTVSLFITLIAAFEFKFLSIDITSFKSFVINFIIELSISVDEISGEFTCKLATIVAFCSKFFFFQS